MQTESNEKQSKTDSQFERALTACREVFAPKLHDYGASWRIMRPETVTDQLFIKAKRIRTIEVTGENRVGDGVRGEFMALVNYGLVGIIQLSLPYADRIDISAAEALSLYDHNAKEAFELMKRKNHDYGEAWRDMRVSSYTDLILTKIERIKEIEDNRGETLVSEGIASNYMDIINYALFGIIRLDEAKAGKGGKTDELSVPTEPKD